MTELAPITPKNDLATVSERTRQFVTQSISPATRRAYSSDLRIFTAWCETHDKLSMPAEAATIADFLSDQAEQNIAPSTLVGRIAAIRYAHEAHGYPSPTADKLVSATLSGIKRAKKRPSKKKEAATAEKVITMLAHCDTSTLTGKRDKALLLIGFAGAFRRSELAALTVNDIQFVEAGIRLSIRSSKTDQEGEGEEIAILNGKMHATNILKNWLDAAHIDSGPLFRGILRGGKHIRNTPITGKSIALIVKNYALKAGFDPAEFAGHSLRSGFVTSAAENGANLFKIMEVSRHKSVEMVKGYVRSAEAFKDHAGSGFL